MKIVTAEEMRRIDREAMEVYGIPGVVLMENAGAGIARIAGEIAGPLQGKTVTLVCGRGNNGGDGFVAARHLLNGGGRVRVFLAEASTRLTGDARIHWNTLEKMGGEIREPETYTPDGFRSALMHSHLIVDALLGTGLNAPVRGEYESAIGGINEAGAAGRLVLSVDIPSGIHADTGAVMGCAVKADFTVTPALPKRGHFLFPGADRIGRLFIQEIGIPGRLLIREDLRVERLEAAEMAALLPPRPRDAHKGDFGHVLVIAGSRGKSGAAAMTALAALRVGAGLVTLAAPQAVQPVLASKLMEVMTHPLPETLEGTLAMEGEKILRELAEGKAVAALGPGLTDQKETREAVRRFIRSAPLPLIVDADGINALAEDPSILAHRTAPTLLTPHPGEMGRLLGISPEEIQSRRVEVVQEFCARTRTFLVLKGAYTLIGDPAGRVFINPTGNPGMATAGTGDVLTGMIAGLAAQGLDLLTAARAGVFWHGCAGDRAAREVGERGMIAGDLLDRIPGGIS